MKAMQRCVGWAWVGVVAVLGAAVGSAGAQQASDRMSEPGEQAANEAQPPRLLMDLLGVGPGQVIGEVGAGGGRLTIHLASRVGPKGRVYAADVTQGTLDTLRDRARRLGLSNVETVTARADTAGFPVNALDLVLVTGGRAATTDPVAFLRSLGASVKPWGLVALVEPKTGSPGPSGPPPSKPRVLESAKRAGLVIESIIDGQLKADVVYVLRPSVADVPESHNKEKVRSLWVDYVSWAKTAKGRTSPRDYAVKLDRDGVAPDEVRRRMLVLRSQFTEQPEGIEMLYDSTYGKPLTGDPEKDGFKTAPNAFLVEAARHIKPGGRALDVGAGMGRNALHLASLGWDVTAIDLSAEGLKVLQANAAKAGLTVKTVRTSYQEYDFGESRWDLVAMILSWAPIEESDFLDRIKASIKPGGFVIFEHNLQRQNKPFPPGVHAPPPGALREWFKDFDILIYREESDFGDWGGPPIPHVRMVARKKGA